MTILSQPKPILPRSPGYHPEGNAQTRKSMFAANGKHGNIHLFLLSHALAYVRHVRNSPGVFRARIFSEKVDFCDRCKMDMDYDKMTIVELRAFARTCELRG